MLICVFAESKVILLVLLCCGTNHLVSPGCSCAGSNCTPAACEKAKFSLQMASHVTSLGDVKFFASPT